MQVSAQKALGRTGTQSMTIFRRLLFRTPRFGCNAGLLVLLFAFQQSASAEFIISALDERCENRKLLYEFGSRFFGPCEDRAEACADELVVLHDELLDNAQDYCWRRPLSIDPHFVGPCPKYMEMIETAAYDGDEWVLPRASLRLSFNYENDSEPIVYDTFKSQESLQSIRRFLANDPDNPIALKLLDSLLLDQDNPVERLKLEIKLHELDPDCPQDRWMRATMTYHRVNELADNWLDEQGPGSELTKAERRELLQNARRMLLNMYSIAVEKDYGTDRLYWALESLHDSVLSMSFHNFQQVARDFEIDLKDFVEKRRSTLIRKLSHEYDLDSEHGRTQSLGMMCNDYAFELGLTDHCYKLLDHFGSKDAKNLTGIRTDWTQAAILLVNAVTRDCSRPTTIMVCAVPIWRNNRQCVANGREMYVAHIDELLSRFPRDGSDPEKALLEAFLSLDETSDDNFLRAFALDVSIVPYAARLSKRLLKRGEKEAALNILLNTDVNQSTYLSGTEKELLEDTIEAVRMGSYRNSAEHHREAFRMDIDGNALGPR